MTRWACYTFQLGVLNSMAFLLGTSFDDLVEATRGPAASSLLSHGIFE